MIDRLLLKVHVLQAPIKGMCDRYSLKVYVFVKVALKNKAHKNGNLSTGIRIVLFYT